MSSKKGKDARGKSVPINTKEVFDGLVRNAIRFLKKAIEHIKDDLQQSVIDFATAIELFLKARLLIEHWTLILNKPENADLNSFQNADFVSVSQERAIERLRKVIGLKIPQPAEKAFQAIWRHRNKMVHFYHPDYHGSSNEKAKEEIIAVQFRGWAHLYLLLSGDWASIFVNHQSDIDDLHVIMKGYRDFLKKKYEALKPKIEQDKRDGAKYAKCFVCGFVASSVDPEPGPVHDAFCQVCDDWSTRLEVPCPVCKQINYIGQEDSERICIFCEETIDIEYLVSVFGEDKQSENYKEEPTHGHCPECHYLYPLRPTAVPREDKYGGLRWLCLSCFKYFDVLGQCSYCGERIAGGIGPESKFFGCVVCEEAATEHYERK
ncbi:MAG: hypothetical protein ACETWD_07935 [Desulfatiglandales bacterium]